MLFNVFILTPFVFMSPLSVIPPLFLVTHSSRVIIQFEKTRNILELIY